MSNRRYVKRVWRVPKDRGAPTYLAALVHKAMVKHGWPVTSRLMPEEWGDGFLIEMQGLPDEPLPHDVAQACEVAVRIVGQVYGVEFLHDVPGAVFIPDEYKVVSGGFVKKVSKS